jgi:hypothetical protein
MKDERNIIIDSILESAEGAARATAPNFFYTRLRARMERELQEPIRRSWFLRPVFALISLGLLLTINSYLIFNKSEQQSAQKIPAENEYMQSLAMEYKLQESASPYDLNQDK